MVFVYRVNRRGIHKKIQKDRSHTEESYGSILKILFFMVTPVIFTTFIYNANAYVDNYIYSSLMGWHGVDSSVINAAYGEFSNYYVTLINVPLALASASASAMMPEVSGEFAVGNSGQPRSGVSVMRTEEAEADSSSRRTISFGASVLSSGPGR